MIASVPSVDFLVRCCPYSGQRAPLFPMSLWEQQEACRRWRSGREGQIGVQVSVKTRLGVARAGLLPACVDSGFPRSRF